MRSGKVVLAAQTLHPCLGGKVLRSLCATTMRALTSLSYSMAEAAAAEVYPWRVLVVLVVVGWRAIIKVRQLIDQIWRVAAGKLTAWGRRGGLMAAESLLSILRSPNKKPGYIKANCQERAARNVAQ
jgi:hypothetical protein